MFYGKIKENDIANGLGIRVTLFVSGCRHHCKGCFNPKTWNFKYGKEFTLETENHILSLLDNDFIDGLTLLGGEPFEPENQQVLVKFIEKVKEKFPNKNIWCYSGYTYEQLTSNSFPHTKHTDKMLSLINVLVDGEFEQDKKSLMLKFRGSSNQRIIDLNKTRNQNKIVLLEI